MSKSDDLKGRDFVKIAQHFFAATSPYTRDVILFPRPYFWEFSFGIHVRQRRWRF